MLIILFIEDCLVTISIDFRTSFLFMPDIMTTPSSIPSGLSWAFLIVIAGKPKIEDSSVIVPLSEITQKALICRKL